MFVKETRFYEENGKEWYGFVDAEYNSWDEARELACYTNESTNWKGNYIIVGLKNLETGEEIEDYGY